VTSIDVIVPCYNCSKYLRECVQSVLVQEGVGVRLLIIVDASPDDTPSVAAELVASDVRVSYLRHEKNMRQIATYNKGIAWVSAKYYLLFSADDFLLPGALHRAAILLDANPSLGFCYGAADEMFSDGRLERAMAEFAPTPCDESVSLSGLEFIELCRRHGCMNVVSTPTAIVRSELPKRTDGYRAELPHSGATEFAFVSGSSGPWGLWSSSSVRSGRRSSCELLREMPHCHRSLADSCASSMSVRAG
jgi:Glycosyl transferase family 2